MQRPIVLRGFKFSVYNWIVRVALEEKRIPYDIEETNPFISEVPETYLKRHPFKRVPVLSHGSFDVYETSAILKYIDTEFPVPSLLPKDAKSIARVSQVISIMDSYGYFPMIRQVFAHRVFRPLEKETADEAEILEGMIASRAVLEALDGIAKEAFILDGEQFTLADCHLAPMIAYFIQAPEGLAALQKHEALLNWWEKTCLRQSIVKTNPGLPNR